MFTQPVFSDGHRQSSAFTNYFAAESHDDKPLLQLNCGLAGIDEGHLKGSNATRHSATNLPSALLILPLAPPNCDFICQLGLAVAT